MDIPRIGRDKKGNKKQALSARDVLVFYNNPQGTVYVCVCVLGCFAAGQRVQCLKINNWRYIFSKGV